MLGLFLEECTSLMEFERHAKQFKLKLRAAVPGVGHLFLGLWVLSSEAELFFILRFCIICPEPVKFSREMIKSNASSLWREGACRLQVSIFVHIYSNAPLTSTGCFVSR